MNIPLNCKRWPRNEETATTPNTPMFVFVWFGPHTDLKHTIELQISKGSPVPPTRTKRIPSNPKRTNNKPKLLPVINSYCLSGWTKVPLQPESQQQLRCILIAAMAGFRTPGQHWEAATPMIAMFSVLGFPSQNAKIHYPVKKVCSFFWISHFMH